MEGTARHRIVFMGTPAFAAVVLEALLAWESGIVAAAYTRPDKPCGRGYKVLPSPVKTLALSKGIPVLQPPNFRDPSAAGVLADLGPDFLVVAAYGVILPREVLETPRFPPLNVHASLLPRYRGAAPMQRAIMEMWQPDDVTGVSIMGITQSLDAGPVYAARSVPLAGQTAATLHDALAAIGGKLVVEVMEDAVRGRARAVPQDEALASYAAKLLPEDRNIAWNRESLAVDAHIRAMSPQPGARTVLYITGINGFLPCLVRPGRAVPPAGCAGPWPSAPGTLFRSGSRLFAACADGWYEFLVLRTEGSKDMTAADLCNGRIRAVKSGVCGRAGTE